MIDHAKAQSSTPKQPCNKTLVITGINCRLHIGLHWGSGRWRASVTVLGQLPRHIHYTDDLHASRKLQYWRAFFLTFGFQRR